MKRHQTHYSAHLLGNPNNGDAYMPTDENGNAFTAGRCSINLPYFGETAVVIENTADPTRVLQALESLAEWVRKEVTDRGGGVCIDWMPGVNCKRDCIGSCVGGTHRADTMMRQAQHALENAGLNPREVFRYATEHPIEAGITEILDDLPF